MRYLSPIAASLCIGLGACASAPVHYHTLLAPTSTENSVNKNANLLLTVLPVIVPRQLDQSNFVVRTGDSGVWILEDEQWAAPFADELRQAFATLLGARLGTPDVTGLRYPQGVPVISVTVRIQRLDAWVGREVQLDASWSVTSSQKGRDIPILGHASIEKSAPGSYDGLVRAEQQAVHDVALRIAGDIDAARW